MEDELHKRIVGMNDAVKALSQAIRRTRAGLKDPRRPGGSFIFAGPTGVGKTELAKTLAEFLFGSEDALIQLDMSEYSEKHTVSRLFGSPPGYVGYEEGGQLTEKVRRKPFSVVLFDEVEKAHPEIFNSLLQVLEDGRLTDSQGRMVDFKNTVIIMTTNLGTRDISKASMGFSPGPDSRSDYERMKNKVTDELKQHFRPEFLNRVDDTIVFPHLNQGRRSRRSSTSRSPSSTSGSRTRTWASCSRRLPRTCSPRRATTPCSVRARCAAPSSARSRTPCPRRSSTPSSSSGQYIEVGTEGEGKEEKFTFSDMAHPDAAHRPADDLPELPEGAALDEALGVNIAAGPSTVPDDQVYPDAGLTGTER